MLTVMDKNVEVDNGDYRVVLTYTGEGCRGDYNPADSEDYPHIRADIYDSADDTEVMASTCTSKDANLSIKEAKEYANKILTRFMADTDYSAERALARAI